MSEAVTRLRKSVSDARELKLGHMQLVQLATARLQVGLSDKYAEILTEVLVDLMSLSRDLTESLQWLSATQEWFNSNVTEAASHDRLHRVCYACARPARTSRDLRNQLKAVARVRETLDETRASFERAVRLISHLEEKIERSNRINYADRQSAELRLRSHSLDLPAKPSEALASLIALEAYIDDIEEPSPTEAESERPDPLLHLLTRLKEPLRHVLSAAAYDTFLADIESCAAGRLTSESRIRLWNLFLEHRGRLENAASSEGASVVTVTPTFEFALPNFSPSPFTPRIAPRDMTLAWKVLADAAGQHHPEIYNARADIIDALKPGSSFQRHETLKEAAKAVERTLGVSRASS